MDGKEALGILYDGFQNGMAGRSFYDIISKDLDRLEELIKLIEILDWYRIMMPYKTFADILEYSNDRVFINNVFNKEWYRRRKNINKELENDR